MAISQRCKVTKRCGKKFMMTYRGGETVAAGQDANLKHILTGTHYGRWTVLGRSGRRGRRAFWLCRCECGTEKSVPSNVLRDGQSQSCGCRQREIVGHNSRTHGRSKTPEYNAWSRMRDRCGNPQSPAFENYGARGIRVCAQWETFET